MKFLIWMVVLILVLAWIMRSKQANGQASSDRHESRYQSRENPTEAMLPCMRCGLHVPASDAVRHASGGVFCSEEHLRQAFPGS